MHLTFLFISHDLRVTRHFCENIAVCYLGNIVEIGPADEILTSPKHPYTASLVAAMPLSMDDLVKPPRKIVLSGDIPSPLNPPSGCRFRTRCFQARPECALSAPQLEPAGDEHAAACFFPLTPDFLRPAADIPEEKQVP
jgi:peptide/nickel transport system ATP-binding protein